MRDKVIYELLGVRKSDGVVTHDTRMLFETKHLALAELERIVRDKTVNDGWAISDKDTLRYNLVKNYDSYFLFISEASLWCE